jgi:hypothetical protein
MSVQPDAVFVPLNIAVLTVSDTRSYANDTSGELLASRAVEVGHRLIARELLKDDLYKIRAQVATWIADEQVQVVLITGGRLYRPRQYTRSGRVPAGQAHRWFWRVVPRAVDSRYWHFDRAEPGAGRAGQPHSGVLPAGLDRGVPDGVGGSWPSSWMLGTGRATLLRI